MKIGKSLNVMKPKKDPNFKKMKRAVADSLSDEEKRAQRSRTNPEPSTVKDVVNKAAQGKFKPR